MLFSWIHEQNTSGLLQIVPVMRLTADPGVASLIPAHYHTIVEIDHEILSMGALPSTVSRRVVVSYKPKYVHNLLVNCLVKLAQEKSVAR